MRYALIAVWLLSTIGMAGPGEGHGGGPSLHELFAEAKAEIPGVIAGLDRPDLTKIADAVKTVEFRWMKSTESAKQCLTVEGAGKILAVSNERCRLEITSPEAAVKEMARNFAEHLMIKNPVEVAEAIGKAYTAGASPFGGEAVKACSKVRFPEAGRRLHCLKVAVPRNYTAQGPIDLCNRHAGAAQVLECLAVSGNANFEPRRVDACAAKSLEPLKDNAAASAALECLTDARLTRRLISQLHFFEQSGSSQKDLEDNLERVANDTCVRLEMKRATRIALQYCDEKSRGMTCLGRFVCEK